MPSSSSAVPYIDPKVEHVGISRLRKLNVSNLRNFDKTLVIQDNDTPLAVLLTYEQFLEMQKQILAIAETAAVLTDEDEMTQLTNGIKDVQEGRVRPLSEIRADIQLKQRKKRHGA